MNRRSTRVKRAPAQPVGTDDAEDDDMYVDDEPEAQASKFRGKKRKAGDEPVASGSGTASKKAQGKKPRGNRGLLKDMIEMPMDVLLEIFGQLHPADLLSLSRTTKVIRGVLMSKTSISCWKQSLNTVGVPPCPEDMSEPAYAELFFGKTCYFCLKVLVSNNTGFSARLRTCGKCAVVHFSEMHTRQHIDRGYPTSLFLLAPYVDIKNRAGYSHRDKRYIPKAVEEGWRQEFYALTTPEAKAEWVEQKQTQLQAVHEHAKACETWLHQQKKNAKLEEAFLLKQRKEIILDKLKEWGWEEELSKIPSRRAGPLEDPLVMKACEKEITAQVLRSLQPVLETLMNEFKKSRLQREENASEATRIQKLKEIYVEYLCTLPADVYYPSIGTVYSDHAVQQVLEDSTGKDITEEQKESICARLPYILQHWREPIEAQLRDIVAKEVACAKASDLGDPATSLQLASSLFGCYNCPSFHFTTEHIIRHKCARLGAGEQTCLMLGMRTSALERIEDGIWNAGNTVYFDLPVSLRVAEVFQACGLDTQMTGADMEMLDPIFECVSCHTQREGRWTFKWLYLGQHLQDKHHKDQSYKIVRLDDELASKVRERMQEAHEQHGVSSYNAYQHTLCVHCRTVAETLEIVKHIKEKHAIQYPKRGEDHIDNPNVRPFPNKYKLWPPRSEEEVDAFMNSK